MTKFFRLLFLSLVTACCLAVSLCPNVSKVVAQDAEKERVVVNLTDDGRALINPGMGWTCHFYSNVPKNYGSRLEPSDTLDWFEGCSTVYLRLPWAYIEPEEGVFNWAIVDTPAQRWIDKGKKVAFRFTTCDAARAELERILRQGGLDEND